MIAYECSSVTRLAGGVSTISCDSFEKIGLFNGEDSDGILKFVATKEDYISGKYVPGQYEVTITGTAVESPDTATATFVLTLIDPCDPPDNIITEQLPNQEYTITDDSKADYTVPNLQVLPEYCEVDYSVDISRTTAGNSAITQDA